MRASHRPEEITYYDELGVAADAKPEEIRDAFRALARLLHPDQHTDPQLKAMAERQMRKLNPIYAVLSDPDRRRRYNEDLEDGYPPAIIIGPIPNRDNRRLIRRGVSGTAALIAAGVLGWMTADGGA